MFSGRVVWKQPSSRSTAGGRVGADSGHLSPLGTTTIGPGLRLGPYEILGAIGCGGMGQVYRARDQRLERDVAIKVLSPRLRGDAELEGRFEQEARAAAILDHPNILAVHDVGWHEHVPFVVTELLDGWPLSDLIEPGGLPLRKVIDFGTR